MSSSVPVRPGDRVSDVLARDESLVDVFARHSPHFEKLRHRSMRRVMARLVTVEQAAGICGATADALVRDLNAALGIETADAGPARSAAPPVAPSDMVAPSEAFPPGTHIVDVDVREDLRRGQEPFSRIMAAAGALPDDAVLHLRAPFEPVPLFTVMAKRGFAHIARQNGPEDWSVWFHRAETAPVETRPAAPQPPPAGGANEIVLDVRGMEPPDPMIRTLEALEHLPPGATLLQVNARVPQFLLPVLVERGFTYELDTSNPDEVKVRIARRE